MKKRKSESLLILLSKAKCFSKLYDRTLSLMDELHNEFPEYGWNKNKGYPTSFHRAAIKEHGITPFHRKSFKLFDTQLKFEF